MTLTFLSWAFTDFGLLVLTTLNGLESDLLCKWNCCQVIDPRSLQKTSKDVEDQSLAGCVMFSLSLLCNAFPQTLAEEMDSLSPLLPQPPVSAFSRTRLWLRRVCGLLTGEVREQHPSSLTHGRCSGDWCVLQCYGVRASPCPSISITSACSSAHSLLFHWVLVTRMMLYVPWGLSGAREAAIRGKGWKNAESSLIQLHCPSGSDGCSPACSGTVFCSSCPVQCTFPPTQTPGCIVPYILANQCQIFYSVFIHPVNRKMDYSESCYLQTLLGLPWGKEEYFYSSRQSFQEIK